MSSKIIKNENCDALIECTAEKEAWKEAQDKAFKKLKANLKIKGFRDGKNVPDSMAKAHIQQADIFDEAINSVLQNMYTEAIAETKLIPVIRPEVSVVKVSGEELVLNFGITTEPVIEIGQYKGLKIEKKKAEVSDEELDTEIKHSLEKSAVLVSVENRAAKAGDTVILDFEGFVDGKAFEGGKAENYSLELGSGQFIPGFEEQLIGILPEESRDVNVKFPEQYVPELAGKNAKFVCKVHEIKEKEIPTLDDEWVKSESIEGVNNVEEYKVHVKAQIIERKEHQLSHERLHEIVHKIVDNSKITISEKLLKAEADGIKENTKKQVEQNGISWEDYLKFTGNTEEKVDENFKGEADHNLKHFTVLKKVGELEGIKVTDEEINAELENMGKMYGMTVEQIKEALNNDVSRIADQIADRKVQDFLLENN